jgi:hypothetical protein
MRALAHALLFFAVAQTLPAAVLPATDGLGDAIGARSMLGASTWARLVRIENSNPRGPWRRGAYPRVVHAVVFELSGILWFYTSTDGTQSLSLTRGTLERDKANPGALFRAIDRGFTSWTWVEEPAGAWNVASRTPPNACFIESVALLYRRLAGGEEASSPELLSYYVDTPGGRLGHTVLVFGTAGGLAALDPESPEKEISFPSYVGKEPMALSAFMRGGRISSARTLALRCERDARPSELCAAAAPGHAGAS